MLAGEPKRGSCSKYQASSVVSGAPSPSVSTGLLARSRYHGAVSLTAANPVAVKEGLARLDGVSAVEIDPQDGRITAFPKGGVSIFERVDAYLREQKIAFSEVQLEQGRLDEVFRQITQPAARKEAHA